MARSARYLVRISVVIPAYNAGAFIDDAIESARAQDYPPAEIIVVNDGSVDRDYDELEERYPGTRVVTQKNRGVSAARNAGCQVSECEYIALLDADDVWFPGKLRAQVEALENDTQCAAVYCNGVIWRSSDGDRHIPLPSPPPRSAESVLETVRLRYEDFLLGLPVAPSTMLIKKAAWQAIGGFDESRRYAEDQEFNIRLSRKFSATVIKMAGVLYRRHHASATASLQRENHWADMIKECVSRYGAVNPDGKPIDAIKLSAHIGALHFFHGYGHYMYGEVDVARKEFLEAIRRDKRNVKYSMYRVLSSLPWSRSIVSSAISIKSSRLWRRSRGESIGISAFGDIGADRTWLEQKYGLHIG